MVLSFATLCVTEYTTALTLNLSSQPAYASLGILLRVDRTVTLQQFMFMDLLYRNILQIIIIIVIIIIVIISERSWILP